MRSDPKPPRSAFCFPPPTGGGAMIKATTFLYPYSQLFSVFLFSHCHGQSRDLDFVQTPNPPSFFVPHRRGGCL